MTPHDNWWFLSSRGLRLRDTAVAGTAKQHFVVMPSRTLINGAALCYFTI